MSYSHTFTLTNVQLSEWSIDGYDPGAKDRRALVRALYGDWFETNKLKLTRDYMVDFLGHDNSGFPKGIYSPGYSRNHKICITIHDPTKALLFKLTHGGAV